MKRRLDRSAVAAGTLFTALLAFAPMACATSPNFDHDPMSITFGGQAAEAKAYRRPLHHMTRRFTELPPNAAAVEQALPVFIRTGSATETGKTIRLRFFDNFDKTKFQRELPATDYTFDRTTPNPGPIRAGVASFIVTFHKAALDDRPFNKIYIVASVNQDGQELGSYCFQTVTVYQNQTSRTARDRRRRTGIVHRRR